MFVNQLCKDKENPELNNGSGFIRFKTQEICSDILDRFNKIQTNPKEKVLLDPENLFEISGRQIFLKKALSKDESKNLHHNEDNKKLLEKLKKGKINFEELIKLD